VRVFLCCLINDSIDVEEHSNSDMQSEKAIARSIDGWNG